MEERYLVSISDTADRDQIRILVIDQKRSKIIHESTSSKDLVENIKQMLLTQYGDEIRFIEKRIGPPLPDSPKE